VLIDLPLDVQRAEIEYNPAVDAPLEIVKPHPDKKKIHEAIQLLLEAKNHFSSWAAVLSLRMPLRTSSGWQNIYQYP